MVITNKLNTSVLEINNTVNISVNIQLTALISCVITDKVKHKNIMFLVHGNLSFRNISTSVLVDDCQQSPWLCSVWTGGIRSTESDFIWNKNGNRITFTPWSPGDPNNKEGKENCIEMFAATGEWNDRKCDYNTFFMCEKNLHR